MTAAHLASVPYKSEPESLTDLVADRMEMGFITVSNAIPQIRAGGLQGVAVTSSACSAVLAEEPALAESGLRGCDDSTRACWRPRIRRPPSSHRVAKLHAVLLKIVVDPRYLSQLAAQGVDLVSGPKSAAFVACAESEMARYCATAPAPANQLRISR